MQQSFDHPRLVFLGISVLLTGFLYTLHRSRRNQPRYPPGPPPDPVLGNVRQFPKTEWHNTFMVWQKQYGDIVHVDLMGQHVVILNRLEDAEELWSKRGHNYSDRLRPRFAMEMMGCAWTIVFRDHDAIHTMSRRILRRGLAPTSIPEYRPLIEAMAHKFLGEVANRTLNISEVMLRYMGVIALTVGYGENVIQKHGDRLFKANRDVMIATTSALAQFWFVDVFPFLEYVPAWFPGANFQRIAKLNRQRASDIRYLGYDAAREAFENGHRDESLVSRIMDEEGPSDVLRDSVGTIFAAGTDTVAGAVANFFYCVLLHPEVQEKLHEELDRVVGQDRLPTFDDHKYLRYLEAVRKEGNRWQPLGPTGIPHKSKLEDTYKGYVFPKNTLFIIHLWYVFQDPRIWDHPERYDPDRFLPEKNPNAESLPDPWETIFGFGRRRCPGQHLASAASFQFCASILWAFNLRVPDGEAMPTPSTTTWRDAIVRVPDFRMKFEPRSERHLQMLLAAL